MSRKEGSFRQLFEYMKKDRGHAAFGYNLCGNPFGRIEDIISEFERNAAFLRERKNGNVLYHEVISLEAVSGVKDADIVRILADVGREYVTRRAPKQMAFGMVHTDSRYFHLHMCLSANAVGSSRRERLSREEFSQVQKEIEALVRSQYAQLNQSAIYGKERGKERLKTTRAEQEMRSDRGEASRKETVKARLHQILESAISPDELISLLKREGLEFYSRGKSVGVIDAETGRKHRLSTLGAEEHYKAAMGRLFAPGKAQEANRRPEGGKTAEPTPSPRSGPDREPRSTSSAPPERSQEPKRKARPVTEEASQQRDIEAERREELAGIFRDRDRNRGWER